MPADDPSVNILAAQLIEWGARVARRRRFLGLTQQQLADHVGVVMMTISRIERGVQAPTDIVKMRIAGGLGEKVSDLFPWPEQVAS